MNPIRTLVVDDEKIARNILENYISKLPNLELVAQCKDPIEALNILQKEPIDLIFLDIQMPELTGIEFLKTLTFRPLVVFTTAYPEYALEGYDLEVLDYLVKPFRFNRFVQAVNKATKQLQLVFQASTPKFSTPKTTEVIITATDTEHILVKSEHKVYRLKYADILYIEGMREYVAFHLANQKILSLQSLKGLENLLPTHLFLRIHKSYIVAINQVQSLEGNQLNLGRQKLPIGVSYREHVTKILF